MEKPQDTAKYTGSGIPIKPAYGPEDVKHLDYSKELGDPGQFPLTRGIYKPTFRDVMIGQRPVMGYGLPEETNKRIRSLLQYGMVSPGGIPTYNLTMDMTSAFGFDSDDPKYAQWVGVSGPPNNSIQDIEAILEDIPLEMVYHGALCYAPNWRLAHYIAIADNRGVPRANLLGATLNDSLHGPIGEGCHLFPPRHCLRLIVDCLKFVSQEMPYFRACDVQAYSSREAGCSAAQEAAFAIADMIAVVEGCKAAGLDVDKIANHLTFFFACSSDFFEEIAKFRAARKVWAQVMKERLGAQSDKSCRMKLQVKTSASTLPAQHPYLNLGRTALQAVSTILSGANGMNITCLDEAYASPTEENARLALLTGEMIVNETGIGTVTDPLAGSYYVEYLTKEMENRIWQYIETIDGMGGYVAALEKGYLHREIANENAKYAAALDSGDQVIIGLNKHQPEEEEVDDMEIHETDPIATHREMARRLEKLRKERDNVRVQEILSQYREGVRGDEYLMPILVEASKAWCTTAEIYGILKEELGEDKNCLVPPDWVGLKS
jgi:methylmalonyl-CoA mutase N-terminal domain/subunit